MKSKHIEALISYRMERSRESIRAAEIMLENEMFAISMNRVYYSILNSKHPKIRLDLWH